jgi:hypothetical protein
MKTRMLVLVLAAAALDSFVNPSPVAGAPVVAATTIDVKLVGRLVDGDQEILAFEAPHLFGGEGVVLDQPSGRPTPWSGIATDGPRDLVLIRRQIPPAGEQQTVTIHPSHALKDEPMRFTIPDVSRAPIDPELRLRWLRSLRSGVRFDDAWGGHSSFRIDRIIESLDRKDGTGTKTTRPPTLPAPAGAPRRTDPSSLGALMDTTTGLLSLREALQFDRGLRTQLAAEGANLPITSISGPRIPEHPWKQMLDALGRAAPDEPLAHAAPARFYYLRFASLPHLFRVLDEADAWITPAATVNAGFLQNQELAKRYEAQLGLQRSLASRVLGGQVVTDVAVVGSDPYLREGTDLTFIFRVKSEAAFAAGLASALAAHVAEHGKQSVETTSYGGQTITITHSEDGMVRQHRASAGAFRLVSNSMGALKVVLDTIAGKGPALADAPDFRYLMARDAGVPADVLGFMSDAFVAEVIGPRQKILEARRMLALADLLVPGYSALLFGWMRGRTPLSVDELFAAGLLERGDLKHPSGEPITFTPGQAARSSWGTVASLVPLIDLPPPSNVTASERDAYRWFADSYQRNWGQYLDPVGLRIKVDPTPGSPLRADLRVLPIIDASDYRQIQRTVGEKRIDVPPLRGGAMVTLGVGPQAEARRLLRQAANELPGGLRAQFDWLGDLALFGIDDRFNPKVFLEASDFEEAMPRLLVNAPIHAAIAVRNVVTAGLTLGVVRKLATEVAPGAIDWKQRGKHRGIPYVTISAARGSDARTFAGDLALHYAFCKQHLLLSLSEATLKARLDDCLDGRLPKPAPAGTAAGAQKPQLVLELAMKKGGPLWQLLGALIAAELEETQPYARARAEILRRGAPGLDKAKRGQLGRAYLASAPIETNGSDVLESLRRRKQLVVPTAGSLAFQFVDALAKTRSEVAFDDEVKLAGTTDPLRSLHIVFSTGTAP